MEKERKMKLTHEQEKVVWFKAGYEDFYDGCQALTSDPIMLEAYKKGWAQAVADEDAWHEAREERIDNRERFR